MPNVEQQKMQLAQFRVETRKIKTHPLEQWLIWVIAIHLVYLPWALGGVRASDQWISLGLASAGFALSLVPRDYTDEQSGSGSFRLIMWPKLLKFPLFWLGLAMLAYVAIQACNPSWVYTTNGKGSSMRPVDFIPWLPTGVRVPFARWGPWRMLIIYAAAWLTVCSVWVGCTRRRSVQPLLIVIAINGIVLSLFGIVQRVISPGRMFLFSNPPYYRSFFASFIYKNHAGNYLNLVLAVTCGLAAWFYLRGLRRFEKSNPSGVFAFSATCIAIAILISFARGATLVMLAFLCSCVSAFIVHQLFRKDAPRNPVVAVALAVIFGIFLKISLDSLSTHEAWARIDQGIKKQDESLEWRELAWQATHDLIAELGAGGAGAGGFRFLFPRYQQRYPAIFMDGGTLVYWEHAHNDLLEITAELGLVGWAIILSSVGYLAVFFVRGSFWRNPLVACLVLGAMLTIVQARWDFPFQCPAIFMLWWVLLVFAAMWLRFEELNPAN